MNRFALTGLLAAVMLLLSPIGGGPRAAETLVELWRLDCGAVEIPDLDFLSDSYALSGRAKTVTVSCYLIRHGGDYMLWDTGLPLSRLRRTVTSVGGGPSRLDASLTEQLAVLKLTPADIGLVALSHYHADHAGQAAIFPSARLVIGAADLKVVQSDAGAFNLDRSQFLPWTQGGGRIDAVEGDRDLFGDGSVIMLDAPGHTPGHHALLVRLASGPVILAGDLWHFAEQVPIRGVPKINTSRAETLASMDRIDQVASNLKAPVILGHDPADIAKLPLFPQSAR